MTSLLYFVAGKYDAFETALEVLRARKDHPDVPPERLTQVLRQGPFVW